MPTMPNLVGLTLSSTQSALQAAGVLNSGAIGYFGAWPITVAWKPSAAVRGTVTAQAPNSGATVAVNPAITLTVSEFPLASAYP